MSERKERCETCRFWDEDKDGGVGGWCRRSPPAPTALLTIAYRLNDKSTDMGQWTGSDDQNLWPFTGCDDWCGEWQPADRTIAEQMCDPSPE